MKPVDSNENPGLAKLPTEVRNKMGYMKKGGQVKNSDMAEDMPMMKKVAGEAVKAHEKKMHKAVKMCRGGGIEVRGKTKGTMIKMKSGGAC